jgi:ABC-type sugar transport system permease subunit
METTATSVAGRRRTSLVATAVAAIAVVVVSIVFAVQTTWYSVFKMLHVGAAVVWVGGGLFIAMCAALAELADDDDQLLQIGYWSDRVAAKVFPLMSFVVLGFGIAMTANGDIAYDQFWIIFGLIAWAASAATGILYLTPETKRLTKAMVERGPQDPEVKTRLGRILLVLRFDVALMLLIVFDMVVKPGA